jgi:hypothetical protein
MNIPKPTILEPDEVAVVYTKDNGYKFLIPDTVDDEEVPDEAAVLVAKVMRLSNDKELSVRRHIIWNKLRPDLKEDLAHLVQDIKRRIRGIASAGSPSFSV